MSQSEVEQLLLAINDPMLGNDTRPVTAAAEMSVLDIEQTLLASESASYRWAIDTDELVWSSNAPALLGCQAALLATGKHFASLADPENVTSRYETVMNSIAKDDGNGVPFQIEYRIRDQSLGAEQFFWLEDQGRWQVGSEGRPEMVYGVVRRIDARQKRDQQLNFMGSNDPLTGMMNRGRMGEVLGEAIANAESSAAQCGFALASINNLHVVNQAYGFEAADEVIVAIGRRLRQVLRGGDVIARYSGGKFGIILNECKEGELEVALQRYLSVIRESVIETEHGPVWASLVIGAVHLPKISKDPVRATSLAEEALTVALTKPFEGYHILETSPHRSAVRKENALIATDIMNCLRDDRFRLAFQPLFEAKTGKAALYEALLRQRDHATGDLRKAPNLVPVAEQLGLVRLVDRAVTQMVIENLVLNPHVQIAMNISGTTAMDEHWNRQLLEIIEANAACANRLTVEITETVALNDFPATRRFVEAVRKFGCGVAIDDFGAGHTSFRTLRELPVTMLKFDGSFCRNFSNIPDNEYMVRSLIDLATKLNLKTVAEWVENADDAKSLTDWGIDYLQGNFLGAAGAPPWGGAEMPEINELPNPIPQPLEQADLAEKVEDQTDYSDLDASINSLRAVLLGLAPSLPPEERGAA